MRTTTLNFRHCARAADCKQMRTYKEHRENLERIHSPTDADAVAHCVSSYRRSNDRCKTFLRFFRHDNYVFIRFFYFPNVFINNKRRANVHKKTTVK